MNRVLSAVIGDASASDYAACLRTRLARGSFADQTDWLLHCLASTNSAVIQEALGASGAFGDPRVRAAVRQIIPNRGLLPEVRARAMQAALEDPDKATLLTLTEVLDDRSPSYRRDHCPLFAPDYPLADRATFQVLRPLVEHTFAQPAQSIGQIALKNLKKTTKRDFGDDPKKWRAFLRKSRF